MTKDEFEACMLEMMEAGQDTIRRVCALGGHKPEDAGSLGVAVLVFNPNGQRGKLPAGEMVHVTNMSPILLAHTLASGASAVAARLEHGDTTGFVSLSGPQSPPVVAENTIQKASKA